MTSTAFQQRVRIEPRWPAIIAILALLLLLGLLPLRIRLLPPWMAYVIGLGLLGPMIGTWASGGQARWLRIERLATIVFVVAVEAITLALLYYLIGEMMTRPAQFNGRQLFTTSVAGWFTNILVFALLYWRIDRGGPEARTAGAASTPDWLFPQASVPEVAPPDWRPMFVDYLSIAFTAAAAFSPAEALPLTRRAKLLMMVESSVSLVMLVVVASRAIGLLSE